MKPLPASPQDGTSHDVKAMVQDMVKSSLTQLAGYSSEDPHTASVTSSSMGEIFDSDQEGRDSGTPELNQLVLTAEKQLDYDSFPTPSVTKASLWRFAEETPPGSQTPPKSRTATTQAQPVISTPAKPSGSQIQAPAQAQPQAPAQAQTQPLAPAQSPRLAPAYFPQPQAAPPRRLDTCSQNLYMMRTEDRLSDFPESEASLIAIKQTRSE